MELLFVLLVLLLVTRVFGEVAARFGQPVLVGELLSGVALGVVVRGFEDSLPVLAEISGDEVFRAITDLSILFLMLLAGVEMRPKDLSQASKHALPVALGGILLPLALGLGLGHVALPESEHKPAQMLYLGVAMSVTAVPITITTLMQLGQQRSRAGTVIVSAAVFDDVLSLFLLAVLMSLLHKGAIPDAASLGWLGARIALFFAVTLVAGRWIVPFVNRLVRRLRIAHADFSTLLLWALVFSVLAEVLGLHFVLGAYAAGLFFTRRATGEAVHGDVHRQLEAVTLGFFAPLFFASIGLKIELQAVTAIPLFLVALITLAALGKVVGAGAVARWSGLSWRESFAVGVGMNTRGAIELIIADIALRAGLFERPDPPPPVVAHLFSAVAVLAVFAAVTSPIGLRMVLARR